MASSSASQEIVDPKDPVVIILRRFEADELGIVKAADMLEQAFKTLGMLYDMVINPRQVGFDPINRDATGCNVQEVLLLAQDIAFVGFSWAETSHAMCVEIAAGDKSVENFNRMISTGVGLAPVEEDSIHFGSLSCGHTNYGLRCISAAVPSSCPLLSQDGVMSLAKLEQRDPEYAKAVRMGLHWKVLRASVRALYPKALPILQGARNVSGHVQRKIHEVQGLQQLHSMAALAQRQGEVVDWAAIKRAVLRSRPPFADSIDDMISFLASRSGGVDGVFLKYFQAFHRQFVNPSVRSAVPGALYGALADFRHHYLAIAILEAAFTCPPDTVKQGLCTWISPSEVAGLFRATASKPQLLSDAEEALSAARTLLPSTGLPEAIHEHNALTAAFAKLDISMARLVLSKQAGSKTVHLSVKSVCRQFVENLKVSYPAAVLTEYEQIWNQGAVPEPASGPVVVGGRMELYAVDSAGKVVAPLALLREKGMDVGTIVASGASDDLYQVAGLSDDAGEATILLEPSTSGAGLRTAVKLADFLANWGIRDRKAQIERHPGWPAKRTVKVEAAQLLYTKGIILAAVGSLAVMVDKHFRPAELLDIFVKPSRKVVAMVDCDVGVIVLSPDSTGVKVLPDGRAPEQDGTVEVIMQPPVDECRFVLTPATSADNVSPLWCVATTEKEEESNMSWVNCSVGSLLGVDFVGKPRPKQCLEKSIARRVKGKSAAEAFNPEDETVETTVVVPVLLNHKFVKKGAELVLYRPRAEKRMREVEAITIGKLAKKAKQGQ